MGKESLRRIHTREVHHFQCFVLGFKSCPPRIRSSMALDVDLRIRASSMTHLFVNLAGGNISALSLKNGLLLVCVWWGDHTRSENV